MIFYECHKSINVMSRNFDSRRKTWGFKTKKRLFQVVLTQNGLLFLKTVLHYIDRNEKELFEIEDGSL